MNKASEVAAKFSTTEIDHAIDEEAQAWAEFFDVANNLMGRTLEATIASRKSVMRANVNGGYVKPLLPFLRRNRAESMRK